MSVLDLVGNTPLIELSKIARETPGVSLYAKAEFLNPSGSVKDRAARAMVLEGLREGRLHRDRALIDATSGNTGIAYALLGAALDFPVVLYLPANASWERKGLMRAYNAAIMETSPLESSDGAFLAAQAEAQAHPDRYFYPDQYNNEANWKAHYDSTGPEIWEQTGGRVSHFICGLGTSGTFMGTSRRLKTFNPRLQALAVQPDSPLHGIEGTKHMASTIKPGFYDPAWPDGFMEVDTEGAFAMTRRLAREEGLLVGVSSGANVLGALHLARTLASGSVVVTILCDGGSRYLSESFWGIV